MHIIEIQDETNINASTQKQSIALGIDFGTTHSLIAIAENGITKTIADQDGVELVPSIAKLTATENIRSIKRLLGKSNAEILATPVLRKLVEGIMDETNKKPKISITENGLVPKLASQIFTHLKNAASAALNLEVENVVVTVPAYFDDVAKGEVILAAKLAGLNVLRLLPEPTAAAYAYGLNNNATGCYMVYDLGGGTFDVSILNMEQGIFQVIAVGGDNMLGGDDIDYLIASYFGAKYNIAVSEELLKKARMMKERLSTKQISISSIGQGGEERELILTQDQLNDLITPLINRTLRIVKDTLAQAQNIDISGVILVGGSTRIPLISKLLQQTLSTAILSDIDPDKAVAFGAALQAENLTSVKNKSLLIDVTPLSIGLELYGGVVEKVIARNSPIPLFIAQEFTTYADNQTAIQFHIVQGEREMADDCRSLARFELKNIPPAKAGSVKIEVTFAIDANGILSVSALEKLSGRSCMIEVKPTYGLSTEQVNLMLETAYKNAQNDHHLRFLNEAIFEAKTLILHLRNAISESEELLAPEEKAQILGDIENLENAIKSKNRADIVALKEILEQNSENFIANRLNYGIGKLLKGKHIDKV